MSVSDGRVRAIDEMRGICLNIVVLTHLFQFWITSAHYWIFGFIFSLFYFLGPSSFLFVSGVAFTFSIRAREEKVKKNPNELRPPLWKDLHARTLFIYIFALIYNIGTGQIWFWAILQTIAISRVLMLPFMNKSLRFRSIFCLIILLTSPLIYWASYPTSSADVFRGAIYFLLFNQSYMPTILPFFAFFVAGTVVGDRFWTIRFKLVEIGYRQMARSLAKVGIIFVVTALFMGTYSTNWDYGWLFYGAMNLNPEWNFSGLPLWDIVNSMPWTLLMMGEILLLLSLLCVLNQRRRVYAAESRYLTVFSTLSLTVYFWSFTAALWFSHTLDGIAIWMPAVAFITLTWAICWLWVRKFNSKYTIEWVIGVGSNFLLRNYNPKRRKRAPS